MLGKDSVFPVGRARGRIRDNQVRGSHMSARLRLVSSHYRRQCVFVCGIGVAVHEMESLLSSSSVAPRRPEMLPQIHTHLNGWITVSHDEKSILPEPVASRYGYPVPCRFSRAGRAFKCILNVH